MGFTWIVLAGVVLLFIIRAVRKVVGAMTPPAHVQLIAVPAAGRHARDVKTHEPELVRCGFRRIGTWRVDPMKGVVLTAFTHPEQSLCAIVYAHPLAGCFMDVVAKSESDRSLTVTTAPAGQELDQREGHEKIFDKSLGIRAMFDLALQKRPEGPYVCWNAGNFALKFEEAYRKEMAWRAGRGGATRDEVRRVAESSGRKFSDEQIDQATRAYQEKFEASRRES